MRYKNILIFSIVLVFAFCSFTSINVQAASAGYDGFILPYYNGYVEDGVTITSQNTVIDMSGYEDSGVAQVSSEYQIVSKQSSLVFYLPFAGSIDDLNEMSVSVNGETVIAERLYGEMPNYHEGVGVSSITVQKAISTVKPISILDGTGKLYVFSTSEEPLTFSFQKSELQTVFHSGMNSSRVNADGYTIQFNTNTNEEYPYRLFVSDGELANFSANVSYSVSDVSYKDYVDYYVSDEIDWMGEEYRGIIYSHFNRSLNGQVEEIGDIIYQYSSYVFALLKVQGPLGESTVVVDSKLKPLANGLYNPRIHVVRMISAYPQACKYSLEIKTSSELPYVIEENIGLNTLTYEGNAQIADGYYVLSSEKNPDYILNNSSRDANLLWVYIVCGVAGCVFIGSIAWWIFSVVKKRKIK